MLGNSNLTRAQLLFLDNFSVAMENQCYFVIN